MSVPFIVPTNDTNIVGDSWYGHGSTVVLLHAGVTDRRSWNLVAPEVAKYATVLSYDRRGFGDTAPGASSYTHLEDLWSVLDHLQIGEAWLVGTSAGGKLALDAAVSLPDRVTGLVLLSPAVSGAPSPVVELIDPELSRIEEQIVKAEELNDLNEVNRLEIRLWLDGPREAEGRVVGAPRELALEMNRIALGSGIAEKSDRIINAWAHLEEISAPTSVACGALDANHILVRSGELSKRIPSSTFLVIEGMAHLPYLEDPMAVAALVIESISKESSRASL